MDQLAVIYSNTCVLGLPDIFGEIRWLAAKALAAERKAQGIRKPVRLQKDAVPLIPLRRFRTIYENVAIFSRPSKLIWPPFCLNQENGTTGIRKYLLKKSGPN